MADINKLKDKIKSTIYPNGKGAINASDHQAMLLDMADGMAETDTKLTELSEAVHAKSYLYKFEANVSTVSGFQWLLGTDKQYGFKNTGDYINVHVEKNPENRLIVCLFLETGDTQFFNLEEGFNIFRQFQNKKVIGLSVRLNTLSEGVGDVKFSCYSSFGEDIEDLQNSLDEGIGNLNKAVFESEYREIDVTLRDGYINPDGGNYIEEVGEFRCTEMIPVVEGEKLLISGYARPSTRCILATYDGVIFRERYGRGIAAPGLTWVDEEFIVPKGITHIVVTGGYINDEQNAIVKKAYKSPSFYTKEESDARYSQGGAVMTESVSYIRSIKVNVGQELIDKEFTLSDGWNGSRSTGYTHTSGKDNPLVFDFSTTNGKIYLLSFDTSYTADEFANIGIGEMYKILVYNGTSHIEIPLMSDGGKLTILPFVNRTFTISNISLKEIVAEGGSEKELQVYNVLTDNHTQNYGFWNILLGGITAQNGVGITRTLAIGYNALGAIKGGHRNIGIGTFAMAEAESAERSISIGADSMEFVEQVNDSIAIGRSAMCYGKGRSHEVAIGTAALSGSRSADSIGNIGIGKDAGYEITGNQNVCIGYEAGNTITAGGGNIVIGRNTVVSGNAMRNTCLGERAKSNGYSDSIALGSLAENTKSNQMVLGSSAITEVVMCGNKKIIFNSDGSVTWEQL